MNGQQLELTLAGGQPLDGGLVGRVSPDRAAWWFDRIHSRLRQAMRPTPPARHEQERLALISAGEPPWFFQGARRGAPVPPTSEALERAA